MRQKSYINVVIGIIALALSTSAQADPRNICDSAAAIAAQNSDVPLPVLLTIARVETGRNFNGKLIPWPWAANVSGESYFFDSKSEAMEFAAAEIDQGRINFDIGCFQVNLRWHSKGFASLDAAFDPVNNASYAANFLSELFLEKGNWADAVSAYHSRTPEHAANYLEKVKMVWADLKGTQNISATTANDAPVQHVMRENNFPLLQLGRGVNGSIVPQQLPNSSRFVLQ